MSGALIKTDVAILGAGLVGLAAALVFHLAGYEVVLVDAQQAQQANNDSADWDQRIYAISPKNAQWLMHLGAWQLLDANRITEMQAMEIWGDATTKPLQLFAEDANADGLGFIVEERALKHVLMQRLQDCGVRTIYGEACAAIETSIQGARLQLKNQSVIQSTLLLAADGANSWIRRQLGIAVHEKPYDQTAIVANFIAEKSHGSIARQWFTQDASGHVGIMAWLPLPDNTVSIVWSASTQHAETLLKLEADAFTQQVMAVGDSVLGEFKLISVPAAFPLILKKASQMVEKSVVLIGDAAHRIHPMAGQGVNLGFRDVIDLLDTLSEKHQFQNISDAGLLAHYERMRKADLLSMTTLTNGLYHLFDSQSGVLKKVRNQGLIATNQRMLKKLLVTNAIAI